MERALYIGRFQPFHNGHLKAIEFIDEKEIYDEIIVSIGYNTMSFKKENPFTLGERIEMIEKALENIDFNSKISVRGISDIENNPVWVNHISSQLPKFSTIYSNNVEVELLVEKSEFSIAPIEMHDRETYEGTTIRSKIANGEEWKHYVPNEIHEFMIKNEMDKRIYRLFNKGDKTVG